jgi:hypothetical protein
VPAKDPDILVDLTTARTDFEAEVIVNALNEQGIPARAFTTAGAMLQWEAAVSQPMRIVVRRRDFDAAKAALRAIRADSVDLDWDEVDTGDTSPTTESEQKRSGEICPACGYDLHGVPARICPECATDLRQRAPGWHPQKLPVLWIVAAAAVLMTVLLLGRHLMSPFSWP